MKVDKKKRLERIMNPQERAFCGDMAASIGFIYLMDVPTGRIKVGFSENPHFRVKNLRSIVPDLAIVDKWPALKIRESTARYYVVRDLTMVPQIKSGAGTGASEVYERGNIGIDEIRSRATEFFSNMPDPSAMQALVTDDMEDDDDDDDE